MAVRCPSPFVNLAGRGWAGHDFIGLTTLIRSVISATDQAAFDPVVPGSPWEAAVAADAAVIAAGHQILGGKVHVLLEMDACAV